MATIKVRQNGPYLVEGDDVTLVDWNGATYQIAKRPFALCRCGGAPTKTIFEMAQIRRLSPAANPAGEVCSALRAVSFAPPHLPNAAGRVRNQYRENKPLNPR